MSLNRFYLLSLITIVIILGYLNYQIFKPFLTPIAWAIVLSLVFYPLYAFSLKFLRYRAIASILTLLIILIIILGPFSYFSLLLINEVKGVSEYLEAGRIEGLKKLLEDPHIRNIIDRLTSIFNISEAQLDEAIMNGLSRMGKEVMGRITGSIGDIMTVILNFVFMSFSIFFFLKDGTDFLRRFRDYMPFSEEQKDRLTIQMRDIIISTIYGGVIVAMVQGIIGGITYSLLGIRAPVIWGVATAIASFIPLLGAFAVWGPIAGYLFIQGSIVKGIILTIVGVFGISLIDNILRPIIIGSRTKMPVLMIFFSVLGGIKLFGLIGLIMGPFVLAVFISVIEIFRNIEEHNHPGS
jgi:predicted PurR-regulated permease PerM